MAGAHTGHGGGALKRPSPARLAWVLGCAALVALCAGSDAQARTSGARRTLPVQWIVLHSTGGPTCDVRTARPVWVYGGTLEQDLRELAAHPQLGIHYMIDRDGTVRASVPEDRIAHHVLHYSPVSLGIELVNDGDGRDPYPEAQLAALVRLLRDVLSRHPVDAAHLVGHSDLDHGRMACDRTRPRKVDPGPAFPLAWLREQLFGQPAAPR